MKWIIAAVAAAAFAFSVATANAQQGMAGDNPTGGGLMGSIQQWRQQHQTVSSILEKLVQTVEAARTSNDPAQMHSALDEVHNALPSIQGETSACSQVMAMCGQQPAGATLPGEGAVREPQS